MKVIILILQFLIFPGFLFTVVVGLLASWVDRKITARLQYRIGPPWYQSFVDIVKLLCKEILIPKGSSRPLFLLAPLIGLAGVTLVSTLLWLSNLNPNATFIGDIIVVLYLLTLPALGLILGGFASGNSLASIGSSREMKLILSYELPFILAMVVPIIKAGGALTIGGILNYQATNGIIVSSVSGTVALIVAIFCMQAKLGLVPFDIPEAETEIMGGPIIEYSGAPLAIFKLTKAMLLFVAPTFLIITFMGGIGVRGLPLFWGILKYLALLVIIILIRNTNPRIKINQTISFFWGHMTLLAVIAVVLALFSF